MKNMKIGHKLALGFTALIISNILVAVLGIWTITRVDQAHVATINYPMQRYTYLWRLEPYLTDTQQYVGMVSFIATALDTDAAFNEASEQVNDVENIVNDFITRLRNNLLSDSQAGEQYRLYRTMQLDSLQELFSSFLDDTFRPMLESSVLAVTFAQAAMAGGYGSEEAMLEVERIMHEVNFVFFPSMVSDVDSISMAFNEILTETQERIDEVTGDIADEVRTTIAMIIIALVIGIVVSIAIMYFVARSISKPVQNASDILEQVAKGHTNINFDTTTFTKNEVGNLNHSTYELVQVIGGMV